MAPGRTALTAILCLEGSENTTPQGFFLALLLFSIFHQREDRLPNQEDSIFWVCKFLDPLQVLKNSF